ncbi:hypothetical protein MPY17_00220 [Rhodococcus opacus]|uniref:hypothetical protein n=1 Tax=Rhodococcus opacus TaxID=37919 RepID=UPI001FF16E5D|nr:hypothetical protein [Rhodococcus opacus]UOT04245.1 hypothetical protein MPY17_00220 [Rhodococcus opacus]
MYHQFEIPAPDELARFHQIASEPLPDTPGGYILRASTDRGGDVELVVDPLGRSIRLRFSVLSHLVFDLFREGATRLRLTETDGSLVIAIEFEAGEIAGTLHISVGSTINVKDSLLFR